MIEISTDIKKAKSILESGELVAIPTETVYGLAANIYNAQAVEKIFSTKKRPFFNPLIVHIYSMQQMEDLVTAIPYKAKKLAKHFWPGALTLVLPKNNSVPDLVTGGQNTVALRIPHHPLTLSLLQQLPFPIAAPSANPYGSISPTTAQHVANYFQNDLQMVLDGGPCEQGLESTIIGFRGEQPILYRLGSITIEAIEKVVGMVEVANHINENPAAPGMLPKHYAPTTPTFLKHNIIDFIETNVNKKIGVILFKDAIPTHNRVHQVVLSQSGNLEEAAAKLYDTLHQLDKMNLDMIVAQYFPNADLGKTINDRLQRAAKK